VKNLGKNKSYINYSYRVKHPHPPRRKDTSGSRRREGGYLIYFNEKQGEMKV